MADNGSARAQLSNAASFIKIVSWDCKLGEKMYSTGATAIQKSKNAQKFWLSMGDCTT
jgi:hypothetical protein